MVSTATKPLFLLINMKTRQEINSEIAFKHACKRLLNMG